MSAKRIQKMLSESKKKVKENDEIAKKAIEKLRILT